MTGQEIIAALKKEGISVDELAYMDYTAPSEVGTVKEIEQKGGEDMGSEWYSIQHFPEHDVYLKISGYYQSYNGTDFEDWDDAVSEVKPIKKIITVFE